MYLHLGNNIMLKKDRIIAIIDIETGAKNRISKNFLSNLHEHEIHRVLDEGKDKSVIISDDGIYLSPISTATLYKRSAAGFDLEL